MKDVWRTEQEELDDWVKVVDRLPFVSSVKRDFNALRRLLYDRRAPRVVAVGAPGSGRTALANALLHAMTFGDSGVMPAPDPGRWVHIDASGRRLDWMELPASEGEDALLELARRGFEEQRPDLLLGVLEAGTERDAGAKLKDALQALQKHLDRDGDKAPVVIVVTKADGVPPGYVPLPYPQEKTQGIELALQSARKTLAELGQPDDAFLAASALPNGDVSAPRYNVEAVGEAIVERLPEAAQLEAVRAFEVGREARRRVGRALVNSCSALAVTVGLAPIPFADAFVLLPLQAAMVTGIAYLSGRPWDRKAASEWLASVGVVGGAGLGLRWGAQQLAKLVPGAGSLVGAGVAGAGTLAIGRSAMAYFIDGPGRLDQQRPQLSAG
ncbi:MAG: DUF697 domain-containing protein [Sandaracinaceae bacterium]|nr:MAG: DUF697 domain-containing protein [Sandaracinaceae bacterium]